jgi:inorganic triphosphatase YgiF
MARELELKFALAPEDEAAFRAAPALAGITPSRARMLAVYFDTPRRELARAGMALRLRRRGGRWVQTLKAGRSGTGGLHSRSEWEFRRGGPSLDLSLFADTPLPRSTTRRGFTSAWAKCSASRASEPPGVSTPRPACASRPSSTRGASPPRDAPRRSAKSRSKASKAIRRRFRPRIELLETVALRPSGVTKAERGYASPQARRLEPAKATEIRLDAEAHPSPPPAP